MQVYGAKEALKLLQDIPEKKQLESFYLYHSLLGEINSRLNDTNEARKNFERAIHLTKSETEKAILKQKILVLLN